MGMPMVVCAEQANNPVGTRCCGQNEECTGLSVELFISVEMILFMNAMLSLAKQCI